MAPINLEKLQQYLSNIRSNMWGGKVLPSFLVISLLVLMLTTGVLLAANAAFGLGGGGGGTGIGGAGGSFLPPKGDEFFSNAPLLTRPLDTFGGGLRGGFDDAPPPMYGPSGGVGGGSSGNTVTQNIVIIDNGGGPSSTPEPISSTLFILGAGAMAAKAFRRKK